MPIDFERIVDRIQAFDAPTEPAQIPPSTPEERARGNVLSIAKVLLEGEGFGAYFVVDNLDHDSQHRAMCEMLGIKMEYVNTTYPITVNGVSGALTRSVDIHDNSITGVWYNVTHSDVLVS